MGLILREPNMLLFRDEIGEMIACRGVVVQARSAKEAETLAAQKALQ